MFSIHKCPADASELICSTLFDQNTFYKAFTHDLNLCTREAIIESPFITSNRVAGLLPIFSKMRSRGVSITINTRQPSLHEAPFDIQASVAIKQLHEMGVEILFTGGHHRKIAVLDRAILWEGSLNILSQNDSCEIMRRTESKLLATQLLQFTKLDKFV